MAITTIGGTIQSTAVTSNLDYKYGPYADIQTANDALGPNGIDKIALGLTVGIIQQDNTVKEYWYQPNSSDELELVEKIPSSVFANPTEPATETIETIGIDGVVYSFPESANSELIEYNDLKTLRNNSELNPGKWYRITDYTCTTTQENTQSAGHVFDIIVHADSEDTLNENAFAIQHTGDTYFSNSKLSSWKIKYSLDNNTTRFVWADDTNGKGVIYYMKDEWDNECPYDFKNIMFKRWKVEDDTEENVLSNRSDLGISISDFYVAWDIDNLPIGTSAPTIEQSTFYYTFTYFNHSDNSIFDNSLNNEFVEGTEADNYSLICQNNIIRSNFIHSVIDSVEYYPLLLNNIVLVGGSFIIGGVPKQLQCFQHKNIFNHSCINMTIVGECGDNVFDGSYDNILIGMCSRNQFREKSIRNIIISRMEGNNLLKISDNIITPNQFLYNTLSYGFSDNIITGNEFLGNTIDRENTFMENKIYGNSIFSNNILNNPVEFLENKIEDGKFVGNSIHGGFKNNTIEGEFLNNNIRDVVNVTFGDGFNFNTIKVSMNSSDPDNNLVIGDNFQNNIIEDFACADPIGDNFQNNIIGSGFSGNSILSDFKDNIIKDNFRSNNIGEGFIGNTIGFNFVNNTINDNFEKNTIGNNSTNNTIDDNFTNNTIGSDFSDNTVKAEFTHNEVGNMFKNNNVVNEDLSNPNGGAYIKFCRFFDNIVYTDILGGADSARQLINVQVWSNIHGTNQAQLTINPAIQIYYTQVVSLKSDNTVRIWNPADNSN